MRRFAFILFALVALSGCKPPPPPAKSPAEVPGTATPSPSSPVKGASAGHAPVIAPAVIVKAELLQAAGIQAIRWREAKIKPAWKISVDKAVMLYQRTEARYKAVEQMRSNGVPAPVLFTLHYRESSNSFNAHLHEGSSLLHRTRYVPKGRLPPPKEPPYQWEVSAEDAIYICDKLQGDWRDLTWSLNRIEAYNGLGYRRLGIPSPYLWSGTTVYSAGKYVSDGHFSSSAIDQQLGCVAILVRMKEMGVPVVFAP